MNAHQQQASYAQQFGCGEPSNAVTCLQSLKTRYAFLEGQLAEIPAIRAELELLARMISAAEAP